MIRSLPCRPVAPNRVPSSGAYRGGAVGRPDAEGEFDDGIKLRVVIFDELFPPFFPFSGAHRRGKVQGTRVQRLPRCSSATAVGAVIVAPFVFLDWSYLVDQYQAMGLKLWYIASAPPAQWIYQADFSTMVRALGIELPASVALALRLAAALGTLALAWRAKQTGDGRRLCVRRAHPVRLLHHPVRPTQ